MLFTLVGHRGAGANGPVPPRPVQILENTIRSFTEAIRLGAHMIEFGRQALFIYVLPAAVDVQLTKDRKPVVFHDFYICRGRDHYQVSRLDYRELVGLVKHGTAPAARGPNPFWDETLCTKCRAQAADYALQDDHLPTLEQVLRDTPPVDFNVEIKFPCQDEIEDYALETPVGVEEYARAILGVVTQHAGSRRIVFSSFHPEICRWLRSHSPYDVLFLTDAGETTSRFDPRLSSLGAAHAFARATRCTGIVANAGGLLKAPACAIKAIMADGLVLFTYGRENCVAALVQQQLLLGVQGIITDDLATAGSLLLSHPASG